MDKVQENYRTTWEQTRTEIYFNYMMNTRKGKRKSMTVLIPFPWDNEEDKKEDKGRSPEEIKEMFKKWDTVEFHKPK